MAAPSKTVNEACLRAEGIVVERDARRILDGASFEVAPFGIATIRGASGSGKSTLLRVLASLVEPDAGKVLLRGVDAHTLAPEAFRRRVGYVAQTPQMLDGSVADNVRAGPAFVGRTLDDAAVSNLLARVALAPTFADRAARDLSGGERVRVALARALANEPEVILLDEPTAALDPEAGARILDLVRSLAHAGAAVVVVTHAAEDAERLGGDAWVCEGGRVERRQENA